AAPGTPKESGATSAKSSAPICRSRRANEARVWPPGVISTAGSEPLPYALPMTTPDIDPERFKSLEQSAWGDAGVAGAYTSAWTGVTSQAIEPILDAVKIERLQWLLDVACGPGILAGVAAERGVRTVGVDFSAEMVSIAQRLHPGLRFEVGDAEALDFPAASFDAVAMNFGLLHLARPEQAISEAARVLGPGGRFAFTVWAPPEEAI